MEVSQEIELTAFRLVRRFRNQLNTADSLDVTAKKCATLMADYIAKNVVHHTGVKEWETIREKINDL